MPVDIRYYFPYQNINNFPSVEQSIMITKNRTHLMFLLGLYSCDLYFRKRYEGFRCDTAIIFGLLCFQDFRRVTCKTI